MVHDENSGSDMEWGRHKDPLAEAWLSSIEEHILGRMGSGSDREGGRHKGHDATTRRIGIRRRMDNGCIRYPLDSMN